MTLSTSVKQIIYIRVVPTNPPRLIRGLSLLDATMIVVGSMIGSGIFITSAESSRLVGSPGWLLMAWALAGVLTITGALCCAELAAMWPRAGGQYVFLREAYGPATGFLFGWGLFLIIQTGTIAAVAVAFANFSGVLINWISADRFLVPQFVVIKPFSIGQLSFNGYAISLSTQQLVAIVMILFLTFINTRGLQTGKVIQNTFTFTKTAALLGLIIVGLLLGWNGASAAYTSSWWASWENGWRPTAAQVWFEPSTQGLVVLALVMMLGRAMVGPLFAQSAWNNVTFTGSEIRDPGKNLPRALLIGCLAVVALYLLANFAYIDEARFANRDTVQLFVAKVGDPGNATPVGLAIDNAFANSDHETRTQSEADLAASQLQRIGDLNYLARAIIAAVFFAILFATGALMMQSIRERMPELAVLKTVGFSDRLVMGLIVAEAVVFCLFAAGVGLAIAAFVLPFAKQFIGIAGMPPVVAAAGTVFAVVLALIGSSVPAWRGLRLQVTDALAGR